MNDILTKKIDRLNKSASNVSNAKNATQKEAARSFLIERAKELHAEQQRLESWLNEADTYINAETPEINADPDAEYNVRWIAALRDYEVAQKALDSAWALYMDSLEAA